MSQDAKTIEIEVFPAAHGDSILVRCNPGTAPVNILVDGGIRATYTKHLEPRFRELNAKGEALDLVIVTHIDSDHIGGILELFKANGPSDTPKVVGIRDVWLNGYRHLGLTGRKPSDDEKKRLLNQVSLAGNVESTIGDISVKEAQTLASLITKNGYRWNYAFDGGAVLAGTKVVVSHCVVLTTLSPGVEEIRKLGRLWVRSMAMKGLPHEAVGSLDFEDAFELEMSRVVEPQQVQESMIALDDSFPIPEAASFKEDTSVINGSSIAFLLECNGKRLLFLADSLPSVITRHWIESQDGGDNEVDLLKVSHHGSRNNTSPEFLEAVRAKLHVISTDGTKHSHPHAETLLRILGSSKPGITLAFNYPNETSDLIGRQPMRDRFGHAVEIGTGREALKFAIGGGGADGN